jgi:hypothetical protein
MLEDLCARVPPPWVPCVREEAQGPATSALMRCVEPG